MAFFRISDARAFQATNSVVHSLKGEGFFLQALDQQRALLLVIVNNQHAIYGLRSRPQLRCSLTLGGRVTVLTKLNAA